MTNLAWGDSDPRVRRVVQQVLDQLVLGKGLRRDKNGKIELAVSSRSPFYFEGDDLQLRAADGLVVSPGSPTALRVKIDASTVRLTDRGLSARLTAAQVLRSDGTSVEADLDAKQDLSEKGVTDGYLGIESTGYADINKLGSLGSGAGTRALHDDGKFKAVSLAGISPTTTKGDLIVDDGSDPVALAVGTDGKALIADSSATEGVAWTYRPMCVTFWAAGSAAVTLTNLTPGDSLTPVTGVTINVKLVDLTGYRQVRLVVHRNSGTCGNGTTATLKYYTALSATEANYLTIGTSAVSVLVDNTVGARPFVAVSSWIDLAAGARADVYITPIFSGGDGASDPTFGYVEAQFR